RQNNLVNSSSGIKQRSCRRTCVLRSSLSTGSRGQGLDYFLICDITSSNLSLLGRRSSTQDVDGFETLSKKAWLSSRKGVSDVVPPLTPAFSTKCGQSMFQRLRARDVALPPHWRAMM